MVKKVLNIPDMCYSWGGAHVGHMMHLYIYIATIAENKACVLLLSAF